VLSDMQGSKNKRLELLSLVHERFRQIQLRTYFSSNPYGASLSVIEVHTLIELDTDRSMSQSEIVAALGAHKVSVSRTLQALGERGLVKFETNPHDSRSKIFSLTSKGRAQLRQLDHKAGALMEQFCWFMSQNQQVRLSELWSALCDGMSAPPVRSRPGIHPLLVPGRRHSRGLGLLGTSVFGVEGVSSLEWHAMSLIESGRCESPTALADTLNIHTATALGLEKRLISDGLLSSRRDSKDRRAVVLSVTSQGKKLLEKIETNALTQLEHASSAFSVGELQEFIELLHRNGADLSSGYTMILGGGYEIGLVHAEEERGIARSFVIRELVRHDLVDTALEYICLPGNALVALRRGGHCQAVIEITRDGTRVDYAFASKDCPDDRIRESCILIKNLCMKKWGTVPELRSGGVPESIRDIW
jgi:DNA-binding MarR family transcriptional regulator